MIMSAPRTSTPASCKPVRMPSSQATPATPPPPRTSARVCVVFEFIKFLQKTACVYHSEMLQSYQSSTAPLPYLITSRSSCGCHGKQVFGRKCEVVHKNN